MTLLQEFDRPLGCLSDGLHLVHSCWLQCHQYRDSVRDDQVRDCRGESIDCIDAHFLNVPVRTADLFDQDRDKSVDKGSKLLLKVKDHRDQTFEEGCMCPQAVALENLDYFVHDVV